MAISDPLLFFGNSEGSKVSGATIGSWRDVQNAAKYAGDLETEKAECHVSEAFLFDGKLDHVGFEINIVDVKWLEHPLTAHHIHE